jgi:hypothetical protein
MNTDNQYRYEIRNGILPVILKQVLGTECPTLHTMSLGGVGAMHYPMLIDVTNKRQFYIVCIQN